ncbi:hypothetical protein LTR53_002663 [Teratosphaeriaceae sp. CCFEE 6253]|nr:hypothetical protein LTR53_002663 [Teratosphaeriaceae sp. CCFEE 6253]
MDELVRQSIAIVEQRKKENLPWTPDEPHNQPYHRWIDNSWRATQPSSSDQGPARGAAKFSEVTLYSWNIDFMLPFPDSRMRAALRHLEAQVRGLPAHLPAMVHLNECLKSDLDVIAGDRWVRDTFHVTNIDTEAWQSGYYGTTSLIDKRLPVLSCFRVHYAQSRMERDGLFVDVQMAAADKPLRFCNTHLESLALEPAFRPPQMALCARHMHADAVHGAVLARDLNSIQDFDRHLPSDNGLKDAYLELGGGEDDAETGHTWGQQAATAQRERFGTSRMDKVLFCGGVACTSFERFGMGVEVEDEREREALMGLGFDRPWVTDHYGVKAVLEVQMA